MTNLIGLVQDYKANIPLHMLEAKYKVPIHTIIKLLYAVMVTKSERREDAPSRQEANSSTKSLYTYEKAAQVL